MITFYIDILYPHQEFIPTMERLEKFSQIKIWTFKDIASIGVNKIVTVLITNNIFDG